PLQPASAQAASVGTGVPGTITGKFEVTPTGAATYSIPITVPPGTAGMEPKLALSYSSQSGNGLLGVGWMMSGLSSITRCPATLEQDGFIDGVDLDGNDRLCLDGQRLVPVSGSYGLSGTQYRTEIESFSKIEQTGNLNNLGTSFIARTKSGLIYHYGTLTGAMQAPAHATVYVWAVDRIEDTAGNYLTITYDQDLQTKEHVIRRIDYSGNLAGGVLPYNHVEFTYDPTPRPDYSDVYVQGGKIHTDKRLQFIRSFTGLTQVREYQFGYSQHSLSQRSHLTSITECAGGQCLPPTVFSVNDPSMAFTNNPVSWVLPTGSATYAREIVADFNGDGMSDVMVWNNPNASQYNLWPSNGDGTFGTPIPTGVGIYSNDSLNNYELGDFNGDGQIDIMTWYKPGNTTQFYLHLSNGNGFGPAIPTGIPTFDNTYLRNVAADFNGDGRTDFLVWHAPYNNNRYNLYLSNGTNFTLMPQTATSSLAVFVNPDVQNYEV
ncbi:MAG: FG-GAP-like repeat-containing protein, partial [Nevskiales bacterium]